MGPILTTLRRTWLAPVAPLVLIASAAGAALATRLASVALGGSEGYVEEVRQSCLLFAGTLALSLAEPLDLCRDARGGGLLLRFARSGGFRLAGRWFGLLLAVLPVVAVAAVASGAGPREPAALLSELSVVAAGGLLLGAFLERGQRVPALWGLLLAAHLRPWLFGSAGGRLVAWALPPLGSGDGSTQLAAALLWTAGALVLADWRLRSLVAR